MGRLEQRQETEDNEDKSRLMTNFKIITDKDLYEKDVPQIKYLIDKYVCESSLIYYGGQSATFKTGLALYIAICGAYKKKFLDVEVKESFKTLIIDEENGIRRTKSKFNRLVDGLGIDKEELKKSIVFSTIAGFKLNKQWVDDLANLIVKGNFKLVIIDNIARCIIGSERDETDVGKIHELLKPLIEKHEVSFLIIHHFNKGDKFAGPNTMLDLSGSRDFGAQADEVFLLALYRKESDSVKSFKLYQGKIKDGIEIPSLNFKVKGTLKPEETPLEIIFDGYIKDKISNKKDVVYKDVFTFWIDSRNEGIYKHKTKRVKDVMKERHKHNGEYVNQSLARLKKEKILKDNPEFSYQELTASFINQKGDE